MVEILCQASFLLMVVSGLLTCISVKTERIEYSHSGMILIFVVISAWSFIAFIVTGFMLLGQLL